MYAEKQLSMGRMPMNPLLSTWPRRPCHFSHPSLHCTQTKAKFQRFSAKVTPKIGMPHVSVTSGPHGKCVGRVATRPAAGKPLDLSEPLRFESTARPARKFLVLCPYRLPLRVEIDGLDFAQIAVTIEVRWGGTHG